MNRNRKHLVVALSVLSLVAGTAFGAARFGSSRRAARGPAKQTATASDLARLPLGRQARQAVSSNDTRRVRAIIQFRHGVRPATRSKALELGGRAQLFSELNMATVSIPAHLLDDVARAPGVRFVSIEQPVVGFSKAARETADVPGLGSYYDAYYSGAGYGLAIIDSGVGDHMDIPVSFQKDFVGQQLYNYPYDPFGHGTHIAGIATGDGWASNYAHWGLAWAADVISLRVLDENGAGMESDVLAALDWLLANGAQYNVRVVNMSLGKSVDLPAANDPLVQAVESVWDAGIVVVVSAGNYGRFGNGTITSPGNSRKVITVGSLTDSGTGTDFSDDYVSSYSSRGPTRFDHALKPDLLAPGNRVVAAISAEATMKATMPERLMACPPTYDPSGTLFTPSLLYCRADFYEMSGTSMAAAMVSGTAIRMISRDPSLSPATVKARLMKSARKIAGDPTAVGAGVLDTYAALDATGTAVSAPSPVLIPASDGSGAFVEDTAQLWGGPEWDAAFIFSDAGIWCDGSIFSDVFVFSDAFPFADAFLFSDAGIWSDASVFSDAFIFSDAFLFSDRVTLDDPDSLLYLGGQSDTINDDLGSSAIAPPAPER